MIGYQKVNESLNGAEIIVGLRVLAYVAGDPDLGPRFLALTGLTPVTLRRRADDPALLAAVLSFLAAHEPNLVACAKALDLEPEALIAAQRALG